MTDVIGYARELQQVQRLEVVVRGIPAPQGSKRIVTAGGRTGGRAVLIESSRKVEPWRAAVEAATRAATRQELPARWEPFAGPVRLSVVFYLPRPKNHFGTGRNAGTLRASAPPWPGVMPDLSKLIRSTEDALTEGRAWLDDSLVVDLEASKRYEDPGLGILPGAHIVIEPMTGGN